MYESEIYFKKANEELPSDILKEFVQTDASITHKSILHWSEHCTECAMPKCYKTCNLYEARIDGKCKRFTKGIERIQITPRKYLFKIAFKKWGALATQANCIIYKKEKAERKESFDLLLSSFFYYGKFLIPKSKVRELFLQIRYAMKKRHLITHQIKKGMEFPDGFILEIFNPQNKKISIELNMRNDDKNLGKLPFQHKIEVKSGYNKEFIPFKEIRKYIKIDSPFRINLIPMNNADDDFLYFGELNFVKLKNENEKIKRADKVKCVVWDLDNTIWDGILIEDGLGNLKLKDGIKEILQTIEDRGIINSIATKNNEKEAIEALNHFGLKDYFLYPQISWEPKSFGLQNIAEELNINLNSFLFVDDSEFERNEVTSVFPQVRTIDASNYRGIIDMKELDVPITEESKKRKQFYISEIHRKVKLKNFDGKYFDFLRECRIKLEISKLKAENIKRVYELTQRTNQMNFSGNRYQKKDVEAMLNNKDLDAYVMNCTDKYGEYGIVGFGVIKKSENRLVDLMFSCRIQSKRVEHAFITFCLKKYLPKGNFNVTYKQTEKNKFSARVFNDFGFETIKEDGALRILKFPQGKKILDDNIVETIYSD